MRLRIGRVQLSFGLASRCHVFCSVLSGGEGWKKVNRFRLLSFGGRGTRHRRAAWYAGREVRDSYDSYSVGYSIEGEKKRGKEGNTHAYLMRCSDLPALQTGCHTNN